MNQPTWKKKARAKNNGDFISIKAYSGYRVAMADPTAKEYILEPGVSDEVLGKAVKESLQSSRHLSIEEDDELYAQISQNYKDWVQRLMTRFGYKTKRALFRNMMHCSINVEDNIIQIEPTCHEKLEAWDGEGFTEKDYVKIPTDSSPTEIGAALQLAFTRCTG